MADGAVRTDFIPDSEIQKMLEVEAQKFDRAPTREEAFWLITDKRAEGWPEGVARDLVAMLRFRFGQNAK